MPQSYPKPNAGDGTLFLVFSFPSYFKLQTTGHIKGYCFSRPVSQLTTCKAYLVTSYKQGGRISDLPYSPHVTTPSSGAWTLPYFLYHWTWYWVAGKSIFG